MHIPLIYFLLLINIIIGRTGVSGAIGAGIGANLDGHRGAEQALIKQGPLGSGVMGYHQAVYGNTLPGAGVTSLGSMASASHHLLAPHVTSTAAANSGSASCCKQSLSHVWRPNGDGGSGSPKRHQQDIKTSNGDVHKIIDVYNKNQDDHYDDINSHTYVSIAQQFDDVKNKVMLADVNDLRRNGDGADTPQSGARNKGTFRLSGGAYVANSAGSRSPQCDRSHDYGVM